MALIQPFPESLRETNTGAGPDFPGHSGDRERGKFRPSETPRLTTLAVVGDDGQPVVRTTDQILEELLLYQRATLMAITLMAAGATFTVDDVLTQVS